MVLHCDVTLPEAMGCFIVVLYLDRSLEVTSSLLEIITENYNEKINLFNL